MKGYWIQPKLIIHPAGWGPVRATAWIVVLLGLLLPLSASADQPIQVRVSAHDVQFGQQVRFHLEVESLSPIQSIVLAFRTSDTHGTTVETMQFEPGTSVTVDYVHDVHNRYIRPFAEITYWWTVVGQADSRLTTEPQSFLYADNRFAWQTTSDDVIDLHWYQGDMDMAQRALDIAFAGLDRARQDISVDALSQPIDIYLYANADDMYGALPSGLHPGVEAQTLYETGVILVAYGPEAGNISHIQRILPHEVTHALLHEITQSEFDRVPAWLSEGLATSVERTFTPDPDAQALLDGFVQRRDIIPLDTLCAAFPDDLGQARLAYAQSASLIDYIRGLYGRHTLRALVAAYADGATCDGGVQRTLGVSSIGLQAQWLDSLAPRSSWALLWKDNRAWLALLVLSGGIPLLFIDRTWLERIAWKHKRP